MVIEYVHQNLGVEVPSIGGYYVLSEEVRLPYRDREVLYLKGYSVFETACCGAGGCAYVLVPGFIIEWKGKKTKDGLSISLIEPIIDGGTQKTLKDQIEEKEVYHQIQFF
ncbi:MAG: hypothetical protein GTO18_21480 [Anaerolineales bacterium]|nr:hypothetical protein [Anaerolineales bacterium]